MTSRQPYLTLLSLALLNPSLSIFLSVFHSVSNFLLPTIGQILSPSPLQSPLRGWPSLKGINIPQGDGPPNRSLRCTSLEGLNLGTVPTFKMHNVGTVPAFKMRNGGTVPTYKTHDIGTRLSYATLEPSVEDDL